MQVVFNDAAVYNKPFLIDQDWAALVPAKRYWASKFFDESSYCTLQNWQWAHLHGRFGLLKQTVYLFGDFFAKFALTINAI